MKLRLHENCLRLRLSQSDVATLAERGRVEERMEFAGSPLVYSIESGTVQAVRASFENGRIRVVLPAADARNWIASDETGIENRESTPRILIEKDFQCLHGSSEENADGFTNPLSRTS